MAKNNNSFGKKIAGAGLAFMMGGTSLIAAPAQAFALPSTQTNTVAPGSMVFKDSVHSLTVSGGVAGARYKVIEVANGSYSVDANGVSSFGNVTMNAAAQNAIVEALRAEGCTIDLDGKTAEQQANAIMEAFEGINGDAVKSQAVANRLAAIAPVATAAANAQGTVSFGGLKTGYYVVVSDVADAAYGESKAMTSAMMVTLFGNTNAGIKTSYPVTTEAVADLNNASAWENDGIVDIGLSDGDLDQLKLTSTFQLPRNWADYNNNFVLEMRQSLPQGMTAKDAEVQAGGSYNVKLTATDGTKTVNLLEGANKATMSVENNSTVLAHLADMRQNLAGMGTDVTVTMEMVPTMDEGDEAAMYGAKATLAGHKTVTANATYTSDPYQGGTATAQTAVKVSNVFSFNLDLTNLDEAGNNLVGSEWEIKKADGTTAGSMIVKDDGGLFTVTGLETNEEYTLTQVTVPRGTRSVDPITFKINATVVDGKVTAIEGVKVKDTSNAVTSLSDDDATIVLKVTNLDGFDLPLTGGAGIIASVVIGSAGLYFAGRSFSKKENN